jgi:predicted HNH restriction endonuclease
VGLEGEARRRMVTHRKREGRLRDARIAQVKRLTGRLACEVKGCGFDFESRYGELGADYAQVHHLRPLLDRTKPSLTSVSDLRVVCANCHAMVHRGGQSRSLSKIAASLASKNKSTRTAA